MRIVPILTAILVTAFLYFLVMERDSLLAFAGVTSEAAAEAAAEEERPQMAVVALHSKAREIDSAVILRGETQAARQVEVKSETSGQVISVPLSKGAFVEAGQELCRIDAGTRAAALAEAEARLAEAKLNETAASKLGKDGFASETRIASAKAVLTSAEAAVAAARRELDRTVIAAPFAGLLETDTAETGSLLQQGALCGTVIQLDPVKIVGFVPETEVSRISVGATAGARLVTGQEVIGAVTFLSRSADQQTRTFRVEIEVANADLSIRDGQTAETLIAAQGAEAHLIPASALTLADSGALGVRVVSAESKAEFRPVTLIRDTAQGVWVTGLGAEADVIVVGQEYVSDGVKVAATYREQQ